VQPKAKSKEFVKYSDQEDKGGSKAEDLNLDADMREVNQEVTVSEGEGDKEGEAKGDTHLTTSLLSKPEDGEDKYQDENNSERSS
jgi:hypothetical protein